MPFKHTRASEQIEPVNAWVVLLTAIVVALAIWAVWALYGIPRVHSIMAEKVTKQISAATLPSESVDASAARSAIFTELGQSGDAYGSLNTLLTAIAGALVFWAGVMQHRALRHAQEEAHEERRARQRQADDMLKTIEISERAARSAEEANRLAKESYVAEQRAWIKLEVTSGGALHYNDNGVNVAIDFIMTNLGSTPALDVFPSYRLFDIHSPGVTQAAEFSMAVEQNRSRKLRAGFTVFPGESVALSMTTSLSKEQIEQVHQELKTPLLSLRAVCIAGYRTIQESGVVHQTGAIYEIQRHDTNRPRATEQNRSQTAIFSDDGSVPPDELVLVHSPFAARIAD